MFKSFWTLVWEDKSHYSACETNRMPEVTAKSSNLYCIYSHSSCSRSSQCKWRDHAKRKERQTVCHIMSIPSLLLHVWLLCLGGLAILFSYLGVQTWERVGKSNQDAKIMTCYAHKHTLYTVDVIPKQISSLLTSCVAPEAPAGNIIIIIIISIKLESQWTSWWIHILSVFDKWKWIRCREHERNKKHSIAQKKNMTIHVQHEDLHGSVCAHQSGNTHTHSNPQQLFSFWVIAMWTVWQIIERQGGANKTLMTI